MWKWNWALAKGGRRLGGAEAGSVRNVRGTAPSDLQACRIRQRRWASPQGVGGQTWEALHALKSSSTTPRNTAPSWVFGHKK